MSLDQYKLCMERGKWNHLQWLYYLDPLRGYTAESMQRALKSAVHHQEQSARIYAEARMEVDKFNGVV